MIATTDHYIHELPTSQTGSKMDWDLEWFVLNPEIPTTPYDHKQVWLDSHPEETIEPGMVIHHINGNHDDNRPENLVKLTPKQHGEAHKDLRMLLQCITLSYYNEGIMMGDFDE